MTDLPRTGRSQIAVEERFVVDVQSFLQELMVLRNMSRSELAKAMGVSRARVTQIFSDECTNLTVRLLARAAHALGQEPQISSELIEVQREERRASRRSRNIETADNVVPLRSVWIDASKDMGAETGFCRDDDVRMNALVERARLAVGAC